MPTLATVMSDVSTLPLSDQWNLLHWLNSKAAVGSPGFEEVRERRFKSGFRCPHCESVEVYRHGRYKDRWRYRCRNRACRKTFNDATATPMNGSKYGRDRWVLFTQCLYDGYSVRKAAATCGIANSTAFYWRHKVLTALRTRPFETLAGIIIESDETFLQESQKGSRHMTRKPRKRGEPAPTRGISHHQACALVTSDRDGHTFSRHVGFGPITAAALRQHLTPVLGSGVLVTDAARGYQSYAKAQGLAHVVVKPGRKRRGIYHLQNVNAHHSRFKGWHRRFKGTATKYLDNYLTWFALYDQLSKAPTAHAARTFFLESAVPVAWTDNQHLT